MSKTKKKHKRKKDKYESLELNSPGREWKKIFSEWDGTTKKIYKDRPERFRDEVTGKIVINKKKKSLRPYDVFLLETYPDEYCCKKTESKEEKLARRERILAEQSKKLEKLEKKQDREFWKAVDYATKHPNKKKNKMTKSEKKIMEFFNKRHNINGKKNKSKQKEELKKYNKLNAFQFKDMVEIDQLEIFIENSKNGYAYGYTKKGKKRNPHKELMRRQMKHYSEVDDNQSKRAVDIFKETLVEEIEARLMYDPFSIDGHPVIDYSKYSANIGKDLNRDEKNKKKKENKVNVGRLII